MGLITNQIIGTARGKIGNFVLKAKKNGVSYISPLPKKPKKTTKIGAINNRKRFSAIVKFSSVVNDSIYLKAVWLYSSKPARNAYIKVYKYNYQYSRDKAMDCNAYITPGKRYLIVQNVLIDDSNLSIEFKVEKDFVDQFYPIYVAIAIVQLSDPIEVTSKKQPDFFKFITLEEELNDCVFDAESTNRFRFRTVNDLFKIINDYKRVIVYFAMVSLKEDITPIGANAKGVFIKGSELFIKEEEERTSIYKAKLESQSSDDPVFNVRIK